MADSFERCDSTPNFPGTIKDMHILPSKELGTYIVGEVIIFENIPNRDFKVMPALNNNLIILQE